MLVPDLPAQGATNWLPWAQAIDGAARSSGRLSGHRYVSVGDSLTIGGDTVSGQYVQRLNGYASTFALLSGGRVRLLRNAGEGTDTAEQMLARFGEDVVPYAPTMVSFLAGTNDFTQGHTDTQFRNAIRALVAETRAIGALPLLLSPPPVNYFTTTQKTQIVRNGEWMARYAVAEGVPFLDVHGLVVDPTTAGNYKTVYDYGDGIHMSVAAHIAIGNALADLLNPLLPKVPVLSTHNLDPRNLLSNGLFINGTTIATGFSQHNTLTSGALDFTLVTDPAMPGGQAQRFTASAAVGDAGIRQWVTTGFSPGDTLLLACAVNNQTSPTADIIVGTHFDTDNSVANRYTIGGRTQVEIEFVVPTGTAQVGPILEVDYKTGSSGTVDFGGMTLRNLTTGDMVIAS